MNDMIMRDASDVGSNGIIDLGQIYRIKNVFDVQASANHVGRLDQLCIVQILIELNTCFAADSEVGRPLYLVLPGFDILLKLHHW